MKICPFHPIAFAGSRLLAPLRLIGDLALLAHPPHEALWRIRRGDGGGDHERLDVRVRQAGDGGGRVIRVEGGEEEVARSARLLLTAIFSSLQVADFSHEDDVRVLAEEGAQRRGEGQPDLAVHLWHLVDPGQLVYSIGSSAVRMTISGVLISLSAE